MRRRNPFKVKSNGKVEMGVPTEHLEQASLFEWASAFEKSYPDLRWLHAIPNQGAARLKNLQTEGTKRGVPDTCLPVSRLAYNGCYIELKRRKGGKISSEQFEWLEGLSTNGYLTAVAYGWDQAREILLAYLHEDNPKLIAAIKGEICPPSRQGNNK